MSGSWPGDTPPPPPERTLEVEGLDVRVTGAGQYIVTSVDGQARLVTVEEYRGLLARKIVEEVPSPEAFRLPEVVRAGGLPALKMLGKAADILREAKARLFAA